MENFVTVFWARNLFRVTTRWPTGGSGGRQEARRADRRLSRRDELRRKSDPEVSIFRSGYHARGVRARPRVPPRPRRCRPTSRPAFRARAADGASNPGRQAGRQGGAAGRRGGRPTAPPARRTSAPIATPAAQCAASAHCAAGAARVARLPPRPRRCRPTSTSPADPRARRARLRRAAQLSADGERGREGQPTLPRAGGGAPGAAGRPRSGASAADDERSPPVARSAALFSWSAPSSMGRSPRESLRAAPILRLGMHFASASRSSYRGRLAHFSELRCRCSSRSRRNGGPSPLARACGARSAWRGGRRMGLWS